MYHHALRSLATPDQYQFHAIGERETHLICDTPGELNQAREEIESVGLVECGRAKSSARSPFDDTNIDQMIFLMILLNRDNFSGVPSRAQGGESTSSRLEVQDVDVSNDEIVDTFTLILTASPKIDDLWTLLEDTFGDVSNDR